MRHFNLAVIACVLGLAISAGTASATDIPPLTGRVNDNAGVFTPEQHAQLATELKEIETKTSTHDQVVLLITPSLQGEDIRQFGIEVSRGWQLGQKHVDNGVLIIIAPHERKIGIEVGTRLEAALTDTQTKLIIHEQMVPHLARGSEDYFAASEAGIAAIRPILLSPQGAPIAPAAATADNDDEALTMAFLIILLASAGAFIVYKLATRGRRSEDNDESEEPMYRSRSDDSDESRESDVPAAILAGAAAAEVVGAHSRHRAQTVEQPVEDDDSSSSFGGFGSGSSSSDSSGGFSSGSSDDSFSGGGGGFSGGGASDSF